jgi:hypothetical protein
LPDGATIHWVRSCRSSVEHFAADKPPIAPGPLSQGVCGGDEGQGICGDRPDTKKENQMSGEGMTRRSLDYIGILEGTDKTSLANDYLRHYERILGGLRDAQITLLEIGVAEGASLRTWERFLPSAKIVGVDINEACRQFTGGRVTVEIGSQADPLFLSGLAAKYQPSIVIDDGSHQTAHIFITFEHLFPSLPPGAIYIIEDVYLHHGVHAQNSHGQGGITPTEYFARVASLIASQHLEPEHDRDIQRLINTIDHIEFISRAIVIYKRDGSDVGRTLDYLVEAATQANQSLTWYHLSWILMTHGDLERGEFAAQRALTLAPHRAAHWPRLADAQARRGKLGAAIGTLREAIKLDPTDASLKVTLAGLEAKRASMATVEHHAELPDPSHAENEGHY